MRIKNKNAVSYFQILQDVLWYHFLSGANYTRDGSQAQEHACKGFWFDRDIIGLFFSQEEKKKYAAEYEETLVCVQPYH